MFTTQASKQTTLGSLISNDQAMPFMMPEGKLASEIDGEYFLKSVPFYSLYDDVPSETKTG